MKGLGFRGEGGEGAISANPRTPLMPIFFFLTAAAAPNVRYKSL